MPGWLVHMEMERDAEAWIGRAVKWGWVGEAIGWTRQLLRDVSTPCVTEWNREGQD
jgi:nuclear pore complex protein Nup160